MLGISSCLPQLDLQGLSVSVAWLPLPLTLTHKIAACLMVGPSPHLTLFLVLLPISCGMVGPSVC